MERPSNYRFVSSFDKFRRCVDIAKDLLEKKQLMLLFGYQKKVRFRLWLNAEQFCDEYPDMDFQEFRYILFDEIAYIIEQNIVTPELEEPSLVGFLREEGFEEAVIPQMVQEKADKRRYVQEGIILENAPLRYRFKENTLTNKLSSIHYEINKYVFSDKHEIPYAVMEFVTVDKLGARSVSDLLLQDKGAEKIKFVCDKQDLEYIIRRLEQIKEKL
ncbi:MAG: hypothetical protein HDR27_11050 [Lachnospiraceae bacterium]|nr:hypothetical protein [Lachnospiraceae bacterium]